MKPLDLISLGFDPAYDAERTAAETGSSVSPLYKVDVGGLTGATANKQAVAWQNPVADFIENPSRFMPLIIVTAVLWLLWTRK